MPTIDSSSGTRVRDALIRLHEVNHRMATEQAGDKILALILDHALAFTHAERAFLVLRGEKDFQLRAARRSPDLREEPRDETRFPRSVIDRVLRSAQPLLIGDAAGDDHFNLRDSVRALGHASVACIPLRHEGQAVGVIYLDHRFRRSLFRSGDILVLESFAQVASGCLDTARLQEKVREQEEEIRLLSALLDNVKKKLKDQA